MAAFTLIAHRGIPCRYPENTLVGFQAAVRAGAEWLETDVQFSRDFQPMLYHDATLERTSSHDGACWDFDAAQLRKIGAGEPDRLGDQFAGEPILSLEELVQWLMSESVEVMIELKAETIKHFGVQPTVDEVMHRLCPIMERCVIVSRQIDCLEAARRWKPYSADEVTPPSSIRIGWVLPDWNDANQKTAASLSPEFLLCRADRFPIGEAWWSGAWQWVAYTINDPRQMLELAERGAQLIETDDFESLCQHTGGN